MASNPRADFRKAYDDVIDENGNGVPDHDSVDSIQRSRVGRMLEMRVRANELMLLEKEVWHCYYEKRVNHFEECRELAERYCNILHGFGDLLDTPTPQLDAARAKREAGEQ